ncbi:hypothetical protein [Flavobacterium beibuense]|uniref:hypothetical protein n=1 Tax=Flavobacterium beibuense TaxID=657326 RepID=UPI003A8E5D0E
MVSDDDRKKLKVLLGSRYTTEVLQVLAENNIINQSTGQPYSTGFISNVFAGVYENTEIEDAFYTVYERREEKQNAIKWKRERLNTPTS